MLLGLILIIVLVTIPVGYLVWRFRSGEESVPGGSLGGQVSRRKKDDWGPKS